MIPIFCLFVFIYCTLAYLTGDHVYLCASFLFILCLFSLFCASFLFILFRFCISFCPGSNFMKLVTYTKDYSYFDYCQAAHKLKVRILLDSISVYDKIISCLSMLRGDNCIHFGHGQGVLLPYIHTSLSKKPEIVFN